MKPQLELIIQQIVEDLFANSVQVALTRPDEQFGDYATNVALQLAKQVGQNPRQVAQKIAEQLKQQAANTVQEVTIAGPGFINIRVHDVALMNSLDEQIVPVLSGKTILVEYSDPNPLKPLHAGHLYTTLVGDTIARLVENAGASTVRLNYGGDVGLHVAKNMWAIIKRLGGELPERLSEVPEDTRSAWLGERYVEGNNAYEDDETAKAEIVDINKRVYALHAENDHESPFAQIYWTVRTWSYDYFVVLYDQLQVTPFDRYIPESEVTALGLQTVRDHQGNVFTDSDGAVVFEGDPAKGLHTRVFINSAGLPTYEAKDVGLSLTKWNDYRFDESIIITANEQAQYMQVVIAAISQIEVEPAQRTRHLVHGMLKLQGAVKMSSRKGNILTALSVLEAARQAGEASGTNPSEETVLAAVKYALAKNRIGGDVVYDPKESIALEGNSGPYLQYAHARARSIARKSAKQPSRPAELTAEERTLVAKIGAYNEAVELATHELMPHHICTYLYDLAQTFNRFYESNRVVGDEREAERLWLIQVYADRLKAGLNLLGITAPDQM